jgi:hypothetical protein
MCCRSWIGFLPQFTGYFLYQGFVQFMQARYQKARHYARMAMGKAHSMDVSNTETLAEFHNGLWLIILLVVIAQAWQLYNGFSLFRLLSIRLHAMEPWYNFREEIQCGLCGALFVFLGLVNFKETISTLLEKNRRNRRHAMSEVMGGTMSPLAVNKGVAVTKID